MSVSLIRCKTGIVLKNKTKNMKQNKVRSGNTQLTPMVLKAIVT